MTSIIPRTSPRESSGLDGPSQSTNTALQEVFLGAIDQGTTSSRFLIFNTQGIPVASHQIEFTQIYPQPGWHEHDPLDIISSVETCIEEATKSFEKQSYQANQIKAIGITNQRETTVVWDKDTGEPLYNAIVWTDTRTQALVRQLKSHEGADILQMRCGLPLTTYPSAGKLIWLIQNVGKVADAYARGNFAFGTIDTWLVYKLNGGPKKNVFVTDVTNASRTMLMNIDLLEGSIFCLPEIVRSADSKKYGSIASGMLAGIPITGCLGDQPAALVGQKGFTSGRAKNTYGTGCFLLYHVGDKPVISKHGLLSTVAYDIDGEPQYALEGSIAVAGSSVKFLQNNFGFIDSSDGVSALAETVDDNGGCTFVTAFSGLFALYWIDDAKGTIFGLTAYIKKGHIARATLEATCFQTKAILDAMEKDSGTALATLAVDGGMTKSDLCMQNQADLTGISVERPQMLQTTALGAAIAAGFGIGIWKSFDELATVNETGLTTFVPEMSALERDKRFARWEKAVNMCRGWSS